MTKKASPKETTDVLDKLSVAGRSRPEDPAAVVLARVIVDAVRDKKALDVVLIDLRGISDVADFFVLASGESDPQVKAIADGVRQEVIKACDERPYRTEGYAERQWVLMDYVDVVVHVFDKEHREFYELERLWADAKLEEIDDDAEVIKLLK